ncbi:MAG: SDR family NAD(P)-dependent oxidoreductase [Acidobacteriia bacterium]|nr:SDR family NAD(P)-dependent oxidoreductase [Terriglobia bacterium]
MRNHSNSIFVTGGGAGIGRGLAEAFHKLGNQVIIGGRREAVLSATCAANPGMSYVLVDVANGDSIRTAAHSVLSRFPPLNCVINNAGIQRMHDFSTAGGVDETGMVAEIETNLLGLMRMCAAFIPHLSRQPEATLINISSGLGFVPLARVPVYCATKAATHSFCVSLRHQLKHTPVRVVELIPPWVDTNLDKGRPRPAGRAPMALPQFIAEAMEGLSGDADEVPVGDAKFLYASAGTGDSFAKTFTRMNP